MKAPPPMAKPEKPAIYLCDDDDSVRSALGFLLRQHDFEVNAFASGPQLLAHIEAAESRVRGVFVLDMRMEPLTGTQVHDQLIQRGLGKRNPVIFLSGHGDIPAAVEAMSKGAMNFVEKPYTDGSLVTLLHQAMEREAEWFAQAQRVEFLQSLWDSLSPQQRRVALMVADGDLNKIIADKLGLSDRMVEVHRAKAFEKLGVDSAAALATTVAAMKAAGMALHIDP